MTLSTAINRAAAGDTGLIDFRLGAVSASGGGGGSANVLQLGGVTLQLSGQDLTLGA